MDNILLPPSRGPIDDVSATRSGVVAMAPSFTRLQKRDPACNLHRYYILDLQPHLFGGWSVIREWGRIGHPGQMRVVLCDTREEADRVFGAKLCQKQRRGYA
jgi:predicted DNA-binding WGR domain protein